MELIPLLNKNLKSAELIDLFEAHNVKVTYAYDRLYEGTPDEYRAAIASLGLEFIFDEKQLLCTLFIYLAGDNKFSPANPDTKEIVRFASKAEAIQYAEKHKINFKEGGTTFFGQFRDWIKFNFSDYSIHYEFRDRLLNLVTLQQLSKQ